MGWMDRDLVVPLLEVQLAENCYDVMLHPVCSRWEAAFSVQNVGKLC